jgi:plasmid maintenance system antidote protein VapI
MNTEKEWQRVQDLFVRELLSEMGRQRMTAKQLAQKLSISPSWCSEMLNCKKPMSLELMIRSCRILKLQFHLSLAKI